MSMSALTTTVVAPMIVLTPSVHTCACAHQVKKLLTMVKLVILTNVLSETEVALVTVSTLSVVSTACVTTNSKL